MPAGWVEAGVAAVGAAESISSNNSAKSAAAKNNANAATTVGAQNTMLNDATTIANQPFEAYTGTLTAPMSGNEQSGYDLAASTAANGVAQGDNSKATGLVDQVANNGWSADTAGKYMNPYTQSVTDASIAASNKSYLQSLAGLKTQEAGSGAFGGGRAAIQQSNLTANQNMNVGSLTATGNANAYDEAVKTWQTDNATKLSAANAYEQAGQDVTNMNSTQISDLMKTGGVAQVISQTDLSNQYNQFMRQQNWSAGQLNSLISANSSTKGGVSQLPAVQSNTANQLLGLGSTVAGLFGGSSSTAGTTSSIDTQLNANSDAEVNAALNNYSPTLSDSLSGTGSLDTAVGG